MKWIPVTEPCNKDTRIFVFSPEYSENNPMRYRIIDSQFLKTCKDVSHYAYPDTPADRGGEQIVKVPLSSYNYNSEVYKKQVKQLKEKDAEIDFLKERIKHLTDKKDSPF